MSYHLAVRWDRRPETIVSCASRFASMLERLARVHPLLDDWRRQANTRAAAYKPFCAMPPRLDELASILERGRHFRSITGELSPELGYSASAWNGRDEPQSLSFMLDVGVYYQRRLYPNDVSLLGLRPGSELIDPALLGRVLLTIAECWEADWGVVETWGYTGLTLDENDKPLLPYGGWLTYLAPAMAAKISPPAGVFAERRSGGGLFMRLSTEPFDVANPVHVARSDLLQRSLAPVQRTLASVFYEADPQAT